FGATEDRTRRTSQVGNRRCTNRSLQLGAPCPAGRCQTPSPRRHDTVTKIIAVGRNEFDSRSTEPKRPVSDTVAPLSRLCDECVLQAGSGRNPALHTPPAIE